MDFETVRLTRCSIWHLGQITLCGRAVRLPLALALSLIEQGMAVKEVLRARRS